jgi:DNA-binding beta-propeller fold protein YncE
MGLAFDSSGNLYASDITGNTISKFTPAGVQSTFASGLNGPNGLVFDGSGNLYEAEYGPDTIFKITPAGTRTVFASHLDYPFSLAFNGNLFEGDFGHGLIYKFTSSGGKSTFASANQPEGLAFEPPIQFRVVATVPLPATANGAVAVNQALNKIYASGGASSGQDVVVIDGTTFATTDLGAGSGSGANVDVKTDHYWAGTVSGGSVVVRDGNTNNLLATVSLGNCPISTTYDFAKNRIWVGAQCGNGNDPVFAIDANSFQKVMGTPVGSGGVMGPMIANGANGRLYLATGGVSKRVHPTTFAVTSNAFGTVMAINTLNNRLYACSGNNLQIINGSLDPETILTTIALSYSPASIGVSPTLSHLYLANPNANCLEVRNSSTGALISTFSLASFGVVPSGPMVIDSTRSRIYVIGSNSTGSVLLVIEDLTSARASSANLGT